MKSELLSPAEMRGLANGQYAEQVVLGLVLRDPEVYQRALALGVTGEHFKHEDHGKVWQAMGELSRKRVAIDLVSVSTELPGSGTLLLLLMDQAPVAQNIDFYLKELQAIAWRADAAKSLSGLASRILSSPPFEDAAWLKAEAQSALEAVSKGVSVGAALTPEPEEQMTRFLADLEKRMNDRRGGRSRGIPTGLQCLDIALGGWMPGSLTILAARPSLGKTTLALSFLIEAAVAGNRGIYFTNEMPDTEILGKAISRETRIYGSKIHTGSLTNMDCEVIGDQAQEIVRLGLQINDKLGRSIEGVESEVRRLKRLGRCKLAIVDYIQQMRCRGRRFESRQKELSEISMRLKQLALDERIPVIALAQLNREAESAPPKLSHLKDCGDMEQDADSVIFIHRDRDDEGAPCFLVVAKNRFGKVGPFRVDTMLAENRFTDSRYNHQE